MLVFTLYSVIICFLQPIRSWWFCAKLASDQHYEVTGDESPRGRDTDDSGDYEDIADVYSQDMINTVDMDDTGSIDFPEFLKMMSLIVDSEIEDNEIRQKFEVFDGVSI